jgi:hypothetical protein
LLLDALLATRDKDRSDAIHVELDAAVASVFAMLPIAFDLAAPTDQASGLFRTRRVLHVV